MIYMRNITITTAKSATYLENVGDNQFVPPGGAWMEPETLLETIVRFG